MSDLSSPSSVSTPDQDTLSPGQIVKKIVLILGGLALGSFIGLVICFMLGIISC